MDSEAIDNRWMALAAMASASVEMGDGDGGGTITLGNSNGGGGWRWRRRHGDTTTIRRSRPRRSSTGTIGAGRTRWETPSRGLGGGGGRRHDDNKGGRESCSRRVNGCVASASAPVVHVLPGQGRRHRASRGGEVFPGDSGGVGATPISRLTVAELTTQAGMRRLYHT